MNRQHAPLVSTLVLAALLFAPAQVRGDQVVANTDVWRTFAERIEPGRVLQVRLMDGKRVKAVLLSTSADGITIQPRTRVPVAPQHVPFAAIESLEVQHQGGIGAGKAALIGVGTAAGVFVGLMLIALSAVAD